MRCTECKFWSKITDNNYPKNFNFGKCLRTRMFWECTEWSKESDYGIRVLTKEAEGNLAFVQDGSDYKAELITLPDFGCVQFEVYEK